MKLLTLAIPVYNGEVFMSQTLDSIYNAQKILSNKQKLMLEILISDNKSTDKTTEIIERYKNKLSIKYHCNSTNLGYDRNIDILVEKSEAQYVWFVGCGEILKPNAFLRLLDKLNNDINYTNILLDFDVYDEMKDKIIDLRIYDFNEDILIKSKNDFSYTKYAPAVSANIINKNKWNQIVTNSLVVDNWCHIERILDMIALDENSKTLILPHPYFTLYQDTNGWWTKPNAYLFFLSYIDVINSMIKKGFDDSVVKHLKRKETYFGFIGSIIQWKKSGMKFDKKVLNNMLRLFKYDYFFWLIAFPLLLTPKEFLFIPRSGFRLIKKTRNFIKKTMQRFIA